MWRATRAELGKMMMVKSEAIPSTEKLVLVTNGRLLHYVTTHIFCSCCTVRRDLPSVI